MLLMRRDTSMDVIAASTVAVANGNGAAPGLVFAAGVISSIGPCVAPRFIAMSACASGTRRTSLVVATFTAGLIAAYASFGFAVSLFGGLRTSASVVYGVVAAGMLIAGIVALWRADYHACNDEHRKESPRSLGGIFLLGASFAFVISPCCTPLVATILAYTTVVGRSPAYGAMLLALFALGHAVPLIACGALSARVAHHLRRFALAQATSIVSGALMIALAGYYALLI